MQSWVPAHSSGAPIAPKSCISQQAAVQVVHTLTLGELRVAAYHFAACLRASGYRPGAP